jgi:pSer/pThr/pTyr-binding forkhead associated (FHA) protein
MLEITLELKNTILDTYKIDKPEITIGRNNANDITIDNLAVSDRHARILKSQNSYYLEDLKSTNGTFVNGQKIKKVALRNEAQIEIGKHILTVKILATKDPSADFARTMKVDRR